MNKMCGYSNTLALMDYNEAKGDGSKLRVLPCDAIKKYSEDKPAPTNSSGWYLPSVLELKYVCWEQGAQAQGTTGLEKLNEQAKVTGGTLFGSSGYWSSTENSYDRYHAWYVLFGNGRVYYDRKDSGAFRVRPLLAF